MLKRLPTLEFALAVAVGAVALARRGTLNPWMRLQSLWWDFQRPKVSIDLFDRRLETCRRCPIYYAPLQTCGSPLKRYAGVPKEVSLIGCWCHMPTKARREANCWRYEELCAARELRASDTGLVVPSVSEPSGGWQAEYNSYRWPAEIEPPNNEHDAQ